MDDIETAGQRVKFGARPDDTMPVTWAERGLIWLHETQPNVFANMMLAIVGVERRHRGPNGNGTRP